MFSASEVTTLRRYTNLFIIIIIIIIIINCGVKLKDRLPSKELRERETRGR